MSWDEMATLTRKELTNLPESIWFSRILLMFIIPRCLFLFKYPSTFGPTYITHFTDLNMFLLLEITIFRRTMNVLFLFQFFVFQLVFNFCEQFLELLTPKQASRPLRIAVATTSKSINEYKQNIIVYIICWKTIWRQIMVIICA